MPRRRQAARDIPPPLELECLRALWKLGEANVKDVRDALTDHRNLAYTTVLTLLDRLAKKGGVDRKRVGRAFVYSPAVDREALRKLAVKELVDSYFEGNYDQLRDWLRGETVTQPVFREDPDDRRLDTSLL